MWPSTESGHRDPCSEVGFFAAGQAELEARLSSEAFGQLIGQQRQRAAFARRLGRMLVAVSGTHGLSVNSCARGQFRRDDPSRRVTGLGVVAVLRVAPTADSLRAFPAAWLRGLSVHIHQFGACWQLRLSYAFRPTRSLTYFAALAILVPAVSVGHAECLAG